MIIHAPNINYNVIEMAKKYQNMLKNLPSGWNPKINTEKRKQVGTGGGVSYFTDVFLDGELRASILHTKDLAGKERFMVTTIHKEFKGKYYRKLNKAVEYAVNEEKRYIPLSKIYG